MACHPWVLILVFVVHSTFIVSFGQQCVPLQGSFRQQCAVTGYNQTFAIPFEMNTESKEFVSEFIRENLRSMENCSVGAIGETIMCSLIWAPRCIEGRSQPHLPCRRVCSEYLYRCFESNKDASDTHALSGWSSWLFSLCTLLPNATASTGECYEPPGFEDYHNSSSDHALLQGSCYPNLMPWCQNLNYNFTILPKYAQMTVYKNFYRKNFTGDPVIDAQFTNVSWLHWYESEIKKFPKCAKMLKMMICAESFPPCFPGEISTLYSLCQSVCKSIYETCPEIKDSDSFLKWYLGECEVAAPNGNSSHGYCKRKKWPNPHEWLHQEEYFGIKPTTQPPPKSSIGAGIIVAAVLVPIIVVVLLIAVVYLWRNRMLPWRYFGLKAEDRRDLVT